MGREISVGNGKPYRLERVAGYSTGRARRPTGFWLAYKRLERARFRRPAVGGVIGMTELTLLLEGIDLRVPRFRRVDVQCVD